MRARADAAGTRSGAAPGAGAAYRRAGRADLEGTGLVRRLGAVDGTALVVSNIVGTGIFVTPGIVFGYLPDPLAFLGIWLAGGLLSLAGALSYAELAAMRPRSGGEYVYIREAFGPLAGFLSGWTSFVAGFSGAVAAAAVGFAVYLGRLVPLAGDTRALLELSLGPLGVTVTPRSLVALAIIAAFTLVHLRGLGPGRLLQNALAALSVLTIVALVLAGLGVGGGAGAGVNPMTGAATAAPRGAGSVSAGFLALILVMFTYSGWNAAAYVTEEIRDPGRNVLRALVPGTIVVIVLYLGLNALYLRTLAPAELAGNVAAGYGAAEALFGDAGGLVVTPLILLALASSISAMIVTGPRVYFAMARDDSFPRPFGRVSDGSRVPAFAIAAQGVWSAALVLSGTFEQLLTYTGFAVVLFAGIAVSALVVLRRRHPDAERPFRVPVYPLVPAAFVAASAAMVAYAVWGAPGPALAGALCIAAGVPLFWWSARRAASDSRQTH
ncbi:MAG: amino acid permease [Gemmatimonadetes bacterium]|uniref:Amino acid permease n=1 Tax=Candidatus Kutchimonas denitrificans TaxID=3056748 RepID=A0AAE4Z4K2_9BACT|nr:amino acid permease [Gemmatimonadota bacterium]NIR73640.1 amino acid permease [Candidatus Kutchimonas denitrificans]NIR99599.1 amino acid permease [Gemmatimonadota bacterium]NIT65219.1 amino acid permease [Gemmatimonadota bacterium]NIV23752.1 amino acid permease [Gemmatimonadota bacterium]